MGKNVIQDSNRELILDNTRDIFPFGDYLGCLLVAGFVSIFILLIFAGIVYLILLAINFLL